MKKLKSVYGRRATQRLLTDKLQKRVKADQPIGEDKSMVEESSMAMEQPGDESVVQKSFVERYLIISPESKWKSIFDIFILFMVGYSCFVNMFAFAYEFPTP